MMNLDNIKTVYDEQVELGKIYNIEYKWANTYRKGFGRINPNLSVGNVDIISSDGGVGYDKIENIRFISLLIQ